MENRREAKEKATSERELRAALRLITDEVDTAKVQLGFLAKEGRAPRLTLEKAHGFLPTAEWEQHKGALAIALDDEAWYGLVEHYFNTRALRERLMFEEPVYSFEDQEVAALREQLGHAESMLSLLRQSYGMRAESNAAEPRTDD